MKKLTYLLLYFILVCFSVNCQTQVIIKEKSSWINNESFEVNPNVNLDDISQGNLLLLADYQVHIPKQESFYRFVTKITDNVGVQTASSINVSYDPLYQELIFHEINIIRDGKIINKLDADYFQVIRRELNAENHLYDGSLSAMINLSDVRTNDIIDCNYTIIGFNPIHNNKYGNIFYLNDVVPVGKVHVGLLTNNQLNYKIINTDLQPKITNKSALNYYEWTVTTPEKFDFEDNIPAWKFTHPTVIISDYKNWSDVVNWGVETFKIEVPLDNNLLSEINEIDKKNNSQGEKIKAVLDFVQNDVRYLGYELGIGSYKPNSPNKVFNQRYGDCKDKSLLMVAMLNQLDIEAYPMLVHTNLKHSINQLLPSPIFFDHCVVKVIDPAENTFYYDPTLTNQGGTHQNTHFPNYEYGLVLKPNTTEFDSITSTSSNKVITEEEYIIEDNYKGATLNIVTTYTEVEADFMRNYFKNNGINTIAKENENFYSTYYYNIKSLKEPEFTDNIIKNELTVFEKYKIDSIWTPMRFKEDHIAATFTPTSLLNLLYIPTKEIRNNEINLPYPVARQHNFKIKLPKKWNIQNMNDIVNSESFYYDWDVKYNRKKNEIDVTHFIKIQNSYIKPNDFKQYQADINQVDKSFGFTLYVPKSEIGIASSNKNLNLSFVVISLFKIGIYVLIFIVLILALIWIIKKYKNS
ncbi:DUF3857 domain-containing transglutaminase family protein [Formosa maritima]|uniref:DUF3857 domain-containing transglutaminase family protein n=1 Tax=Formosa maritima TaxID=2592046 RepID=UPI001315ADB1|nr:DUF3857 domain-containing protein [Formosa maritima]